MKSEINRDREIICPVCGKTFIPAPYHVYRVKNRSGNRVLACSWGCVIRREREEEEKHKRHISSLMTVVEGEDEE